MRAACHQRQRAPGQPANRPWSTLRRPARQTAQTLGFTHSHHFSVARFSTTSLIGRARATSPWNPKKGERDIRMTKPTRLLQTQQLAPAIMETLHTHHSCQEVDSTTQSTKHTKPPFSFTRAILQASTNITSRNGTTAWPLYCRQYSVKLPPLCPNSSRCETRFSLSRRHMWLIRNPWLFVTPIETVICHKKITNIKVYNTTIKSYKALASLLKCSLT